MSTCVWCLEFPLAAPTCQSPDVLGLSNLGKRAHKAAHAEEQARLAEVERARDNCPSVHEGTQCERLRFHPGVHEAYVGGDAVRWWGSELHSAGSYLVPRKHYKTGLKG